MASRCVYTDIDGTLLGSGASLFRDAEGNFSMLAARALEACHRADVEVVLMSGRRKAQVAEDARLIGQSAYIYEIGAGVVIDGEERFLMGPFAPRDGRTPHELIERTGAPALLLERFGDRLEHHAPWHRDRFVSHLFRGDADVWEANAALREAGHDDLTLVDNGATGAGLRVYHLVPAVASKRAAVEFHMSVRGYAPGDAIAVGDSAEDAAVAESVGRFFLVANGPELQGENIERTEAACGEGFYEAVVRALAEAR